MKGPEKIYVTPVRTWDTKPIPDLQDNIYISKDALIEWLENKINISDGGFVNMNIPDFIANAKSGDILATKYGSLLMVARVEITKKEVNIYYYFDWHKDDGFQMNEWLTGFYGPKYEPDDNFYRPATDGEKKFFTEQMNKFGFELSEEYGEVVPRLTHEGFMKFYMNK